jgi:hypothetical protein
MKPHEIREFVNRLVKIATEHAGSQSLRERISREVVDTLAVGAASPEHVSNDEIRAVLLQHGYTIKDGYTDLKPYVYDGARAVLALLDATRRDMAHQMSPPPSPWVDFMETPKKVDQDEVRAAFLKALRAADGFEGGA